ncbi:MAG: hypothetical protein R3292_02400 [Alcanivorax sp.]|nr:hypothetical protein [Alcanivorax sp.]
MNNGIKRGMRGYPRHFSGLLYTCLLLIVVTGLALLPTFLDMRLQMDVPWRPDFSQRTGIALLHTGGGLLLAWLLGALWSVHMRAGWRRGKNRISGVLLMTVLVVLMLSCLGIFYAGDEALSIGSSLVHVVAGLLLPLLAMGHWLLGRRLRHERQQAGQAGADHNRPLRQAA